MDQSNIIYSKRRRGVGVADTAISAPEPAPATQRVVAAEDSDDEY